MSARTIWKFTARVADDMYVPMPEGAEILEVRAAALDTLVIWAVVDPDAETVPRRLHVRGTGHELGEVGHHLGTFIVNPLVWHVFEAVDR